MNPLELRCSLTEVEERSVLNGDDFYVLNVLSLFVSCINIVRSCWKAVQVARLQHWQ